MDTREQIDHAADHVLFSFGENEGYERGYAEGFAAGRDEGRHEKVRSAVLLDCMTLFFLIALCACLWSLFGR